MLGVPEYVVNVKIAEVLSEKLSIDCRAERIVDRRRPDIRCFYRGFRICIEASYDRVDAEKDAKRRIESGFADVAIALYIKTQYRDVPEQRLREDIAKSRFDVKIFIPMEVSGLLKFIERASGIKAESATQWFTDIDIPTLRSLIESSIEFLVNEEEVEARLKEIQRAIEDFVKVMKSIDRGGAVRNGIYEVLYKLYGLSVAESKDPDILFGHAGLSILLSATFYEHIRSKHGLSPLSDYIGRFGPIEGLRKALEDLLKIDYRAAVEISIKILSLLPGEARGVVKNLIELARVVASNAELLRKDFAGRVYHRITGDIAVRKGFATFYTEVPAAYLLAYLSMLTLFDLDEKDPQAIDRSEAQNILEKIREIKLGDFACGSGTLLTASYSALMRIASTLKFYHDLDVDLDELGKTLVENCIYGIDALKYASQITAINLALIAPGAVSRENIYTIYLGYIPEKNRAWLGSLELLGNGGKVGGLLAYIEGGLREAVERVSLESSEGVFSIPGKLDLVVMNPPFTRATGRTEKFGEGRGLFGFIVDENARVNLVKAYNRVRESVREDLKRIALSNQHAFPDHIRKIISGGESKPYLSIGQAGEGLLFLHLAYKYVKTGGVVAFVLPRALLTGESWFLARVLLVTEFHPRYIIVSSDPERGYNFSESTSLSEVLVIAKRVDKHEDNEETVFINLLQKPSTALEAQILVEAIRRSIVRNETYVETSENGAKATITRVSRRELLENIDNWGKLVTLLDQYLLNIVERVASGVIDIDKDITVNIPIVVFDNIIERLGIDRHQFNDLFEVSTVKTPYTVIHGGGEEVRSRITMKKLSYANPKTRRAEEVFRNYSSRVLVPNRIWWETAHAIALYTPEPVLSNIFYAIRLKCTSPEAEKALVLWLNTTWGILTVLAHRSETRGPWTQLNMGHWRMLPVLNVCSLEKDALKRLAEVFDKYADKELRRIPDQFKPVSPDPVRLGIDREFIKVFNPSLNDKAIEENLQGLYRHIYTSLKQWIGDKHTSHL